MKKLTAKQEWALEQIKQLQYSENLSCLLYTSDAADE